MSDFSPLHDLILLPAAGLLWVLPIFVGVSNFRAKGYSPYWMWFAIVPLFGWIAMIVSLSLPARRRCDACGTEVPPGLKRCQKCGRDEMSLLSAGIRAS